MNLLRVLLSNYYVTTLLTVFFYQPNGLLSLPVICDAVILMMWESAERSGIDEWRGNTRLDRPNIALY